MTDVQLKIIDGPDTGREFPIGGSLVIGRDASAGIVLEDSEVSRRHATVSYSGGAATIEDLGSTNGTFVNGERIEGTRSLAAGDKVRVGTTVMEVHLPVQATQIASLPDFAEDPGATKMASVMSPEEAERAAKAEEAVRHAEPEGADDTATVVPEEPPAAPEPPAPEPTAPPTTEQPPVATPGPQAPAPGPQSPAPGPQSPASAPPPVPAAAPGPPPPPPAGFGAPAPPPAAPQAPLPQPGAGQPPVGYQAGPGFQVRSPGTEWALAIFTLGIYPLIWYHRLCKEIGEWSQGRIHTSPGTSLLAVTLGAFILVPPWVSIIGTMGRVRQCQQMAGLPPTVGFWGFLGRNFLFGYGYKWITEQLNELAVRRPVQ